MEDFYLIPIEHAREWAFLDLWTCFNSPCDHGKLKTCLEAAWEISPQDTMKLLLIVRNCHGNGLGKRNYFYDCIKLIEHKDPDVVVHNLGAIVNHGYWKDLLVIWEHSRNEYVRSSIIYYYCNQLEADLVAWEFGESVSLASKWAPTEKCSLDKRLGIVSLFCSQLKMSRKNYRKRLNILREALEVPERLICQQRTAELDFDNMPALALVKYDHYLFKNCGKRYSRWLESCNRKRACITETIASIRRSDSAAVTVWNDYINNTSFRFSDAMCICDTSQSMVESSSINVSMTIALIIANTCQEQFARKIISFSEAPEIVQLPDDIAEQCKTIQKIGWGFNINIIAAVEKIAVEIGKCPKQLFIITDLPWYQAQYPKNMIIDRNTLKDVCDKHSVAPPEHIVYWNVNKCEDTLQFENKYVTQGVTIINGFSVNKLNYILEYGVSTPAEYVSGILGAL